MKKHDYFFNRLKKIIPQHIKPKFGTGLELLKWNQEQGKLNSTKIIKKNYEIKFKKTVMQSGIHELYKDCSFDNYQLENERQKKALSMAKRYLKEFNQNSLASFIFSGKPGTGKNHLATAIGMNLILNGKSFLLITVADIMSNIKETFSFKNSLHEKNLLYNFSNIDLLVIDEIGIQIESRYEKIVINQIIDRRSSSKRPTGMLSNLDYISLNHLLGERVMDRMRIGNSIWVRFDWESYRKHIK
ncbi:DNA replication protein DnaC [Candidatus Tachikawaea gelatinosa]|uniref:DNA replication protein n=1 Tax=Candidatus Tachikawaea gelatinosa TaxID=1410383 RepID=A0A090AIP4_9ENTR|nr:DNA replication protein DnaC [Candidatus Tachikawaea gelatinosa]BAP58288.1 DNA replication protein [Candidatus Tachikawaea gelatinosa]